MPHASIFEVNRSSRPETSHLSTKNINVAPGKATWRGLGGRNKPECATPPRKVENKNLLRITLPCKKGGEKKQID